MTFLGQLAERIVWVGALPHSILLGQRTAHLLKLILSNLENIYQCLSHSHLSTTSLPCLLLPSQDPSGQTELHVGKHAQRGCCFHILFRGAAHSSLLSSRWLIYLQFRWMRANVPFFFHRTSCLSTSGLTHSSYGQNAVC